MFKLKNTGFTPLETNSSKRVVNESGKLLAGFTIIETLMFLAVSGVIFISIVLLMRGQLSQYQSRDAMNQLESVTRGVLHDVTNGYYPILSSDTSRGTNQDLLFAGKSISFSDNNMIIDSWVTPILTNSRPLNIATGAPVVNQITQIDSLQEPKDYRWGIKPVEAKTFYILNTIYDTDNADLFVSGAQSVGLFKYNSSSLVPVEGINNDNKVCFTNGGHKSSLTFGVNGALTVSVTFKDEGC